MVSLAPKDFIQSFYASLFVQIKDSKKCSALLQLSLQESDLVNLKDALYKLDYWMCSSFFKKCEALNLGKQYDDALLVALLGSVRETFF